MFILAKREWECQTNWRWNKEANVLFIEEEIRMLLLRVLKKIGKWWSSSSSATLANLYIYRERNSTARERESVYLTRVMTFRCLYIHTYIDETETHQELLFNTSSSFKKKYVININMSFCSSSIVIRKWPFHSYAYDQSKSCWR